MNDENMVWNEFIADSRPTTSRRWSYLNEEIEKKAESFLAGIYVYTDEYRFREK